VDVEVQVLGADDELGGGESDESESQVEGGQGRVSAEESGLKVPVGAAEGEADGGRRGVERRFGSPMDNPVGEEKDGGLDDGQAKHRRRCTGS